MKLFYVTYPANLTAIRGMAPGNPLKRAAGCCGRRLSGMLTACLKSRVVAIK
jgi:hypothetical protein